MHPTRPSYANAPDVSAAAVAELPRWDLTDLYPGPDSTELEADFARTEDDAKAFAAAYAGKLGRMSGARLAAAIAEYERMEEVLGRIMSYAQLLFAGDSTDATIGKFYQTASERVTGITSHLIFFGLELNRLSDAALEKKLADPKAARWRPWLSDLRVFRPHQLDDQLEKLLHEKEVTGHSAWSRLFDETMAGMRIPVLGEDLTVSAALNKLSDGDRDVRASAAAAIGEVFGKNIKLFSLITNTLAKDKEIIDAWRHYPTPGSYRNRSNMVEDAVVDALVVAVCDAFPRISHRYYAMKAKWLGLPKLKHWDRNAPLPNDDDTRIPWAEARERVLTAYGAFSPDLAAVGGRFFQNAWIDAALRPGKSGGAFSHPTVPAAHPYILMNYHGRTRDVMTLAHELGHGVHQVLAGPQGALMAPTPLTLAETASVFGEQLTFRALLARETDPKRRRIMLAQKVEDMINTVVRQIAFYTFERKVHAARKEGELTPDQVNDIWMGVQAESLGDAIAFGEGYEVFWTYIPHFIHSPFYVYAYAFGDCLVNSLYARYQESSVGFQDKYFEMLKAGGTKHHSELLKPFGLNAADPAFWQKGLSVISGMIDELEGME